MSRRLIITGMSGLVAVAFLAASPTAAESISDSVKKLPGLHIMHSRDGVAGTISAINGSTLTVNDDRHATTSVVYTVDASAAAIYKNGATSTLDSILTGEKVFVKGTVSGTSVSATAIMSGTIGGFLGHFGGRDKNASSTMQHKRFPLNASSTDPLRGNFTFGNVTAVNGASFTINDKGRKDVATTNYTVLTDGSTVFKKAGQSSSLSDVTVGQFVMVAGAKNSANDTITATSVNVVTKMLGHGPRKEHKISN